MGETDNKTDKWLRQAVSSNRLQQELTRGVVVAFDKDERQTGIGSVIRQDTRCCCSALPCLEQHIQAVPSLLPGGWSEHAH